MVLEQSDPNHDPFALRLIRGQAQSPNNGATAIKIYSDYELKGVPELEGQSQPYLLYDASFSLYSLFLSLGQDAERAKRFNAVSTHQCPGCQSAQSRFS